MFNNRRVEEDLERIRKANLPPEIREAEEEKERKAIEALRSGDTRITMKDILAMIIAVLSILLPYALIIIVVLVVFLFLFLR